MSEESSDSGCKSLLNITQILAKKNRSKEYLQTAPTKKNAMYYNMKHPKRGSALIFNHDLFTNKKLPQRMEAKIDCEILSNILKSLDFEIKIYDNLNYKEIVKTLEKVAKEDHSDADCLFVAVLTYGNFDLLHARDNYYKSEIIWKSFYADKCPTLCGKPKLFIIQGCQCDELNKLVLQKRTVTEDGSCGKNFCIPNQADFLIFFSSNCMSMTAEEKKCKKVKKSKNMSCQKTVADGNALGSGCRQIDTPSDEEMIIDDETMNTDEGSLSSDLKKTGSLFIKSLCQQLRENGTIYDIHTILTYTIQLVVADFENKNKEEIKEEGQKEFEIPYFVTMLTRLLQFNTKIKRSLPK
ncbi:caspase-1-like [Leptopilina heterotoma]|uniref:caspase-1-like n=1 Tax=Leptopilina heterotoma TaxID=63436 RepID=UPI001CA9DEB4|nr:caspase-1-like [Leptopilina heterotoma]